MARTTILVSACIAALTLGIPAFAEDSGDGAATGNTVSAAQVQPLRATDAARMTSAAGTAESATQENLGNQPLAEIDQVELIQQAIREVEMQLAEETRRAEEQATNARQSVRQPETLPNQSDADGNPSKEAGDFGAASAVPTPQPSEQADNTAGATATGQATAYAPQDRIATGQAIEETLTLTGEEPVNPQMRFVPETVSSSTESETLSSGPEPVNADGVSTAPIQADTLVQEEPVDATAFPTDSSAQPEREVFATSVPVMQYQSGEAAVATESSPAPASQAIRQTDGETGAALQESRTMGQPEKTPAIASAPLFSQNGLDDASLEVYQSGFKQEFSNGVINWYTGEITATGESLATGLEVSRQQAKQRTTRAATIEARKHLMEILRMVPVTDTLRVRTILRKDEDVMRYVRGDMQNSRIVAATFDDEGKATVTVSVKLRDAFLEKLISKHVSFHRADDNPYAAKVAGGSDDNAAQDTVGAVPAGYSGVLIDAREIAMKPALTFSITDESGAILYSPRSIERRVALKEGMAEYAGTWEEALASARTAANPLVLKAVAAKGRMQNDIVISDEQARLLEQINASSKFLEKGKVVIVCQ
ncbi:MAG: hypothetical protein MI749_07325 [Desulfovibrionales bacterium]|nr:hypothetical protein [Desulfovibrionales bacterium]